MMATPWTDVSMRLRPGMVQWPGDPPFEFHAVNRIAEGDHCNTSLLQLPTHTGTHIDAPWHFVETGPRLDQVDTARYFGRALVLDLSQVDRITEADLPAEPLPPRVLFKTRNSNRPEDAPFAADFVAIEADAADRLVRDAVRLVGVDYLSVAPFEQPDSVTHLRLLENDVLVVEGLRLKDVPPGNCEFIVLPLSLAGADGAPCRAFVRLEE